MAATGAMKTKKRVYIRSRGGLVYGWGHVVRSCTLSRYLMTHDRVFDIYPVVEGDGAVGRFLKDIRLPCRSVRERISLREEESLIEALKPDVVITDMLKVPSGLLSIYRRHAGKTVIFNDMGYDYKKGDVIINPQVLSSYPSAQKGQKHLNGTDYFVLSEDIRKEMSASGRRETPAEPKKLIIIMGGCVTEDIFDRCSRVIEELSGLGLKFYFFMGYDNNVGKKRARILEDKGVVLIGGTREVGRLMAGADMALASSGYVKYELAALGVPSVIVSIVGHQERLARSFVAKSRCAEYAGDIRKTSPKSLACAISRLARDRKRRAAMSWEGRKLVDGGALERIRGELISLF